ncbi:ElyC/SanA/YdcF family protein [Leptolyngbya sp. O-77]|uniref:ElyC/SanA/YdcF family protein n=1 Tax=Leptolyngbya sp. O-77 TaxID=1080068 RepID=UPI00074D42BD|nr:ElyC/SanA/YdcF family protein [Leptolyngbya sp. O-77]BAU44716.1 hypothetical protein O77CONTIG1_04561 [Leptolyngbya sp. O-77]
MNVGIICGYGVSLENDLEIYADSISLFLSSSDIDKLILCGGYTVENSPYSEAGLMRKLLQQREVDQEFILEEASVTSLHNLLFAKEILENLAYPFQRIYIFCDSVRSFKVFCLSRIIFSNYSVTIISFGRKEFALMYLVQIPSTVIQALGAIFPGLSDTLSSTRSRWNRVMDKVLGRSSR